MYGNNEGFADESRYMTPEEVAHRKIARQRERERVQKEEARNAELAALRARAEKAEELVRIYEDGSKATEARLEKAESALRLIAGNASKESNAVAMRDIAQEALAGKGE